MNSTPLTYIESDFASADETCGEFRTRTVAPPSGRRMRRAYKRVARLATA